MLRKVKRYAHSLLSCLSIACCLLTLLAQPIFPHSSQVDAQDFWQFPPGVCLAPALVLLFRNVE